MITGYEPTMRLMSKASQPPDYKAYRLLGSSVLTKDVNSDLIGGGFFKWIWNKVLKPVGKFVWGVGKKALPAVADTYLPGSGPIVKNVVGEGLRKAKKGAGLNVGPALASKISQENALMRQSVQPFATPIRQSTGGSISVVPTTTITKKKRTSRIKM